MMKRTRQLKKKKKRYCELAISTETSTYWFLLETIVKRSNKKHLVTFRDSNRTK